MISYIYTGKLILTFEFNTPSSIFPYTQITNLREKEKKDRSTLISYNLKMLEIMRRCKNTINSEMQRCFWSEVVELRITTLLLQKL